MVGIISLTLFYLLTPAILIFLTNKISVLQKIGTVLLAYLIGLLAGNSGLISLVPQFAKVQDALNSLTIPSAIPLLLFSLNIRSWFSIAGKAFISMIIGVFSVIVTVSIGYILFKGELHDAWKIGGMLVGVYTGGTPNLAAIQSALKVDPDTYIMVNSVDILVSTVYLFFLMSIGKRLLRWFLPRFVENAKDNKSVVEYNEDNYSGMLSRAGFTQVLKGILFSVVIAGLSIGLSFLITRTISMLVLVLSITTLAILASLVKQVNTLKNSFQTGMYLILVFSIVVSSMANLNELGGIALELLKYLSVVVFGSLLLHILIGKIFRIDADTLIVTSTALVCSPPFVPVMAGILKNRQVIVSGLTVGIVGYAIGNYLGVTLAYLLNTF